MTTIPVASARADLSKIVERAERTHERFDITRNGERAAVLLGADDYDGLIETVSILSEPETMQELREAIHDLSLGKGHDEDDVRAAMKAAGRL
ncbi:type II toxin-antitoxin system Phd/YefM family antitoxin [Sinomonas mesophila]|uniref:type II toxin-antitoxin system Phd/YefM family antitoxin n=1 Tax=Sinomonas mesophila TaxID=1531955 RepID=UPI001C37E22C|nr:type II toxin-antitoxin system Phd/YefM family antitoxin [Sinomonas mesophila]